MAQEVERMDKKSEHVRIPVLLRINNPRHQFVYNILENVENKSAYIREAVIYYYRHNGISTEEDDILEDIRKVVQECNSQLLDELDKRMERKNSIDYKKLKNMF